ncbi:hypothetical protein [Saezia sanguinis]|uniref:hypothetical protein n=1 Tax=Saezia sanguinis TaxID=1965230 RepID=UPI000F8DA37F|nr:hypothetical protein [Saezia sanguinis]
MFFAITLAWLLVLSISHFIHKGQMTALEHATNDQQNTALIQSLQTRLIDFTEQLESIIVNLSDEQAITASQLQDLSRLVDQRFADIQSRLQNDPPDLATFHERLDKLDEQIMQLSKKQQTPPAQKATPPRTSRNTLKPQNPSAPSFLLIGSELKGGERLLSVAPKIAPTLSNARPIRVGETVDGWTLQEFDGRLATFESQGQIHKLVVPMGEHP